MRNLRFKMLAGGYPMFYFPDNLLEEVDLDDFYQNEDKRLALFVGTQFGIYPSAINLKSFEGKRIAVLGKSQLSGHQSGLTIYEISEGQKIKLQKFKGDDLFGNKKGIKIYKGDSEVMDIRPKDRIPEYYLYEIWRYLHQTGITIIGQSLTEVYSKVNSKAYTIFLKGCFKQRKMDWIDFLGKSKSEIFLRLYQLLDKSIKRLAIRSNNLPLSLAMQLELFRDFRNPYMERSKKNSKIPESKDLLVLSDTGLCVYYNNFININSFEAKVVQNEIIKEFRSRGYCIRNENLLRNHANAIETKSIYGIPILALNVQRENRVYKDIAPIELGPANSQLMYEHFYGIYDRLTDIQLVDELNKQVGIIYWGMGRAAIIKAIRAQLKSRCIDVSSISNDHSFSLKYCVVLQNKKLIRLGDLTQEQLKLILRGYLQRCYPSYALEKTGILGYDLEKLEIKYSPDGKLCEIPINDLLKKK